MSKASKDTSQTSRCFAPAVSPEDQEDQITALATDEAVKRLRNGTASSQLIVECLRRGSIKEKLELEKLRNENALLKSKTEAIQAAKQNAEIYRNALEAMRSYSGGSVGDDNEDYQDLQ